MLERLEEAERRSELAQSEADSRARELERLQEQADHKLREADEIRRKAHAQAGAAIDEALREIRLEAARLFEELKAASGDTRSVERVREDLKALQALGEETAQRFRGAQASSSPPQALKKGQTVRIEGYAQLGTLLDDPKGEEAAVQMGPLRLTVSISRLSAAYAPIEAVKGSRRNLSLEKAMTAHREIHLRSMRAEDAALELEKFLDDAVLAGLDQVRIVHGKGGGVLRQITQDYLRRHPHVRSYRDADSFEGGSGVTIAVLK
jgi:DNA mismatch repair protein MutS2